MGKKKDDEIRSKLDFSKIDHKDITEAISQDTETFDLKHKVLTIEFLTTSYQRTAFSLNGTQYRRLMEFTEVHCNEIHKCGLSEALEMTT